MFELDQGAPKLLPPLDKAPEIVTAAVSRRPFPLFTPEEQARFGFTEAFGLYDVGTTTWIEDRVGACSTRDGQIFVWGIDGISAIYDPTVGPSLYAISPEAEGSSAQYAGLLFDRGMREAAQQGLALGDALGFVTDRIGTWHSKIGKSLNEPHGLAGVCGVVWCVKSILCEVLSGSRHGEMKFSSLIRRREHVQRGTSFSKQTPSVRESSRR